MTSPNHDHVAVIGGGIIGLCSAYFLEQAGFRVTVIERDLIGSGSARGNGGQIVPADPLPAPGMVADGLKHWFSPSSAFFINPRSILSLAPFLTRFALHSNRRTFLASYRKLDQLNSLTTQLFDEMASAGIGTEFKSSGNLKAFRERSNAVAAREDTQDLAALGLTGAPGELLDTSALHSLEPSLGDDARWGFLRPDVRWGDPSQFVDQLAEYLRGKGVRLVEHSDVSAVTETDQGVRTTSVTGEQMYSAVLIAAGPWSKELVKSAGSKIRLVPGKGYSFTVRPERMPKFTVLLGEAHVGATPLDATRLRIAGTMEFGAGDSINQRRINAIAETAEPFLTGIDWDARTDDWAGPRPMTPDGLPYIGRLGRSNRLYVATGHNMLGLSLGPATGQLVANLMRGTINDATLASFAVKR